MSCIHMWISMLRQFDNLRKGTNLFALVSRELCRETETTGDSRFYSMKWEVSFRNIILHSFTFTYSNGMKWKMFINASQRVYDLLIASWDALVRCRNKKFKLFSALNSKAGWWNSESTHGIEHMPLLRREWNKKNVFLLFSVQSQM